MDPTEIRRQLFLGAVIGLIAGLTAVSFSWVQSPLFLFEGEPARGPAERPTIVAQLPTAVGLDPREVLAPAPTATPMRTPFDVASAPPVALEDPAVDEGATTEFTVDPTPRPRAASGGAAPSPTPSPQANPTTSQLPTPAPTPGPSPTPTQAPPPPPTQTPAPTSEPAAPTAPPTPVPTQPTPTPAPAPSPAPTPLICLPIVGCL